MGRMNRQFKIGCSGWYYWRWRKVVYPAALPTNRWFEFYQKHLDTVELNAPFYRWPRQSTVRNWVRQASPGFIYSIKVNQLITHEKRFQGTKTLIREFCGMAEILGAHLGCFLFQLPPSYRYTAARLRAITSQLNPRYRNVVEFRHRSWWNDEVFTAFRERGIIFCSVSAPRLPEDVIKTAGAVYIRFHGVKQWYRYDYSDAELEKWAKKIRASRAREVWAYFNNDYQGCAFRNALSFRRHINRKT